MSKVYIATAIPYVNGNPHIGHAMDYLLADTYARFRTLLGDEVRFQAGTDEHGNKVFKKAGELGVTIEDYTTANSNKFKDFINKLGVKHTDFIRTTDPEHMRRCQEIWQKLSPHIYEAEYDGWYCEGCEGFVTQTEYDENHGVCPDHQKPYLRLSEKNYYLRISDFKEQIKAKIESGTMQILPAFRKQELLKLLDNAPDISISRPKEHLSWGVPVPGDDSQVMYVWIDALSNYITVLGYPDADKMAEFAAWWPAAAQFIGKDILRFHAITWPAILLGLGLELPRNLVVHGYVLADGQKMSKSIGNVVDPVEVIDKYGIEAFRYYFLRHVDTFADSDFAWEKYEDAYNNELANDLGNLVQRLAALCKKNNFGGVEFTAQIREDEQYTTLMQAFEFTKAFNHVWNRVQDLNKQIEQTKPWELAKQGKTAELEQVLQELVVGLRWVGIELAPFLPQTADNIEAIFSQSKIIPPAEPLFPKK